MHCSYLQPAQQFDNFCLGHHLNICIDVGNCPYGCLGGKGNIDVTVGLHTSCQVLGALRHASYSDNYSRQCSIQSVTRRYSLILPLGIAYVSLLDVVPTQNSILVAVTRMSIAFATTNFMLAIGKRETVAPPQLCLPITC